MKFNSAALYRLESKTKEGKGRTGKKEGLEVPQR